MTLDELMTEAENFYHVVNQDNAVKLLQAMTDLDNGER
jgi:hypothetical protein